ncbi:malate dehydrogenase [Marinobacterium rhizophilum]|uniref:malate dehydrogenase n=1 Tax=Marinobacterium rhizophilum TaxID=420402 RepID=UPI0003792010|nr:malate dehydrogenase [Marinobacterium rhizophilum]
MNKLSIVGAGMVGEAAAQIIARDELCRELMLIDVQGELAQGKALDVWQAAVESGSDTWVYGGSRAELLQDSELVVITAGVPRKPGQSRQAVLSTNLPILDGIMQDIKRHAPTATVLVVSNPVDVLTYRAWSLSGLSRNKVFGQAGVLDTARMKCFIAEETGFSVRDISALVLGGHGDSMVPLMRYCAVGCVPLSNFLSAQQIGHIVERTRNGGGEILGLKKLGSACDAPGVAIAQMVDAIANGRNRILPAVAILEGEYGREDVAMGVPCVLAEGGLTRVIELDLNEQERAMFDGSADQVVRDIAEMKALLGLE